MSDGFSLKMVGSYPNGASPYGVLDMSGNVWEWTSSLWGEDNSKLPEFRYPYDPADGRENQEAPTSFRRVVRGGAFDSAPPHRAMHQSGMNFLPTTRTMAAWVFG